jgi:hypothetical protein
MGRPLPYSEADRLGIDEQNLLTVKVYAALMVGEPVTLLDGSKIAHREARPRTATEPISRVFVTLENGKMYEIRIGERYG